MIEIITGDGRRILPNLPAASFDCIVTSPPYWGLRDYGVDGQIGLEPTLDAYVETMRDVFREVRRVLKPSGTCWLNLGDNYAGYHGNKNSEIPTSATNGWTNGTNENLRTSTANRNGLKPKDLCGVPWRVAFALQAEGWWLRSAIIWAKPNPMPESVTDRPTSAYEMVFLLTKADRYFYDADAIREPLSEVSLAQIEYSKRNGEHSDRRAKVCPDRNDGEGRLAARGRGARGAAMNTSGANCRNVWTIATQPFKGAHFATMPPALAERCIKAGCPARGHVLDPFGGAGTTGLVAERLGRDATLIELNPAYVEMSDARCGVAPDLACAAE